MSRSLHTQKLDVRALRRISRPFGKRRREADFLCGRVAVKSAVGPKRLTIKVQKPLPGMLHGVSCRQIHDFLDRLGPAARYGLKSIQCRQESAIRTEGIVFAEYIIGGELRLYSLPVSPWLLPFLLHAADRDVFQRYGAQIAEDEERERTIVRWSAPGLTKYCLLEVLAHEIGHHLLQYHHGKRPAPICRRADHEKRADLQSRRVKQSDIRDVDSL